VLHTVWIEDCQRERFKCSRCDRINYQNPKILVVAMVTCEAKLLLSRRAHKPSAGLWTPPSGFMEENETLEQATARETWEETGVRLDPEQLLLHTIVNLPSISEVYVTFRTEVQSTEFKCGPECLEAGFFTEEEVPWQHLAYPAMFGFLKMFFQELKNSQFDVHLSHVDMNGKSRRRYYLKGVGEKEYSSRAKNTMLDP
jgi:ADP-ribose pyrophosphatase YjhB (NUDIX family)